MDNQELIRIFKNYCNQLSVVTIEMIDHKETKLDRLSKLFKMLENEFKDVDFKRFTSNELKELGFSFWDEELMLAPPWVIKVCKEGTTLTSISGDTKIKGIEEIDTDTRFGMTAYGLTLSELRDGKIENILD